MELREPSGMEELIYFTNRMIGDSGKARVWVFRKECPKCHEGLMGKPVDAGGKIEIRAKEYKCPKCGYLVNKQEYEEGLDANVEYTCPNCAYSGKQQIPFKRKKVKGVETLRFQCEQCKTNIYVTKKMKGMKE